MATRPRKFALTPQHIKLAGEMAAAGRQMKEISEAIGYRNPPALSRAMTNNEELRKAILEGRETAERIRMDRYNAIRDLDLTAAHKAAERRVATLDGGVEDENEVADAIMLKLMPRYADIMPHLEEQAQPLVQPGLTIRVEVPDGNGGWREAGRMRAIEHDGEA